MSDQRARRWLWVAALVTMPVPYYLGQLEWAPVLRLVFLTGLFSAVALAEGGSTTSLFSGLGILQTTLYAGLFFLAAHLGAAALRRIDSMPMRVAAIGTVIFLLLASAQLPLYDTPLSSVRMRSNLWQLFE